MFGESRLPEKSLFKIFSDVELRVQNKIIGKIPFHEIYAPSIVCVTSKRSTQSLHQQTSDLPASVLPTFGFPCT